MTELSKFGWPQHQISSPYRNVNQPTHSKQEVEQGPPATKNAEPVAARPSGSTKPTGTSPNTK